MSSFPCSTFLQTANKNIYSSFMRTDQSYFTKEIEQYPAYKKDEDVIMGMSIDLNGISLWIIENNSNNDNNLHKNPSKTSSKSENHIQNPNSIYPWHIDISDLFIDGDLDESLLKEMLFYNDSLPQLQNTFLALVYIDNLKSNQLLFLVHYLINLKGCKGVMVQPLSIILAISSGGTVVFIYQNHKTESSNPKNKPRLLPSNEKVKNNSLQGPKMIEPSRDSNNKHKYEPFDHYRREIQNFEKRRHEYGTFNRNGSLRQLGSDDIPHFVSIVEDFVLIDTKKVKPNDDIVTNKTMNKEKEDIIPNSECSGEINGSSTVIDEFIPDQNKQSNYQKDLENESAYQYNFSDNYYDGTNVFNFFKSDLLFLNDLDPSPVTGPFLCDICWEWLPISESSSHAKKMHFKNGKCECLKGQTHDGKKKRKRRTKLEMLECKKLLLEQEESKNKSIKDEDAPQESKDEKKHKSLIEGKSIDKRRKQFKIKEDVLSKNQKDQNDEHDKNISDNGHIHTDSTYLENQKDKNNKMDIAIHSDHKHVHFVFSGDTINNKLANFLAIYQKKHQKKLTVISDLHIWTEVETELKSLQIYDTKKEEYNQEQTNTNSENIDQSVNEPSSRFLHLTLQSIDIRQNLMKLLSIELVKELWMTDCEWRQSGVRVFKEKLLFYL